MEAANKRRGPSPAPDSPQRPQPGWTDHDLMLHYKQLLNRERRRNSTVQSACARTIRDLEAQVAALQNVLFTYLAPRPSRNPDPKVRP